jgi:hypothetical protein
MEESSSHYGGQEAENERKRDRKREREESLYYCTSGLYLPFIPYSPNLLDEYCPHSKQVIFP